MDSQEGFILQLSSTRRTHTHTHTRTETQTDTHTQRHTHTQTHTHTHTRIIPQCVLGRCRVSKRGPYPLWACPTLPTIALNSGGWVTLQRSGQKQQRRTPSGTLCSEEPPCPLPSSAPQRPQHESGAGSTGEPGARKSAPERGQTRSPSGGPGPVRSAPDSFSRPGTGGRSSKSSHNQSWEGAPSSIACRPTAESRLLRG